MLRKSFSLFPVFCFALAGCVRDPIDIPPSLHTAPVFFADFKIGQTTHYFSAGDAGYRMQARHYIDPNAITHYLTGFSATECGAAHCPKLELEFFDQQVFVHPNSGVYHTFKTGQKSFYNLSEDGLLDITFYLIQPGGGPGVSYWTTSEDSAAQTGSQLELQARPDDVIDLCFHRAGDTGCDGDASYCFHTRASKPFIGVLNLSAIGPDSIRVGLDLQGTPPYYYTWMNGSTAPSIRLSADKEEIRVEVLIEDSTGSTVEIGQTLSITNGVAEICGGSPQFIYSIAKTPFTQYGTAILRFVDENGKAYSSANGPQQGGMIDIRRLSDFENDPEGHMTKLVELSLHGLLYSADGSEVLTVSPSHMVVAISYDK